MRTLIVGPGYVGMALGKVLARCGHEVFGLRRSAETAGELANAGIKPLVGDITQSAPPAAMTSHFDWVVNCVSSTHGGAEDYRRVYLHGARNLLEWLSRSPPAKLVYTSSTGVYGQNDGSLVDESAPTDPTTDTARVLVETERVYIDAARNGASPAVVLRVAGIYGPGRGWWLKKLVAGEARIEGVGGRLLNMIHRDDVVGCIIAALDRGQPGAVYNAVDDEPVAQRDFLAWLAEAAGRPLPPTVSDNADANRKRGVTNRRISNRRLKQELGYSFSFPTFRQGYADDLSRLRDQGNSVIVGDGH